MVLISLVPVQVTSFFIARKIAPVIEVNIGHCVVWNKVHVKQTHLHIIRQIINHAHLFKEHTDLCLHVNYDACCNSIATGLIHIGCLL